MERNQIEKYVTEQANSNLKLITQDKTIYTVRQVVKCSELTFDFVDVKGALVSIPYYAIREMWREK